ATPVPGGRASKPAPGQGPLSITTVMCYAAIPMRWQTKVTSQGQVSVPAPVRRALGLAAGSTLEWVEEDGGRVVVMRATRHTAQEVHDALFPAGHKPAQPRSLDSLKQGIRGQMQRRHARP